MMTVHRRIKVYTRGGIRRCNIAKPSFDEQQDEEDYNIYRGACASGPDENQRSNDSVNLPCALDDNPDFDPDEELDWQVEADWMDEEAATLERKPFKSMNSMIDFRCSPLWQDYYAQQGLTVSNGELYDFPCAATWRDVYSK